MSLIDNSRLNQRILNLTGHGSHDLIQPYLQLEGLSSFVAANHEQLHDEVLLETPFGFAQYCISALADRSQDSTVAEHYLKWKEFLLNASDLAHESYATFLSISDLPPELKQTAINNLLKLPLYHTLYDEVITAVSRITINPVFQTPIAAASLRAAFLCSPCIILDDLGKTVPSTLPSELSPNLRLEEILHKINSQAQNLKLTLHQTLSTHYQYNIDSESEWILLPYDNVTHARSLVKEATHQWLGSQIQSLICENSLATAVYSESANLAYRNSIDLFNRSILQCGKRRKDIDHTEIVNFYSHGSFLLKGTDKLDLSLCQIQKEQIFETTEDQKVIFLLPQVSRQPQHVNVARCVYDANFAIKQVTRCSYSDVEPAIKAAKEKAMEFDKLSAVIVPIDFKRNDHISEPDFSFPHRIAQIDSETNDKFMVYMMGDFLGWYEYLIGLGTLEMAVLGGEDDDELDSFKTSASTIYSDVRDRYYTFFKRAPSLCVFRSSELKGIFLRFLPSKSVNIFSSLFMKDLEDRTLSYWYEQLQDRELLGRMSIISHLIQDSYTVY